MHTRDGKRHPGLAALGEVALLFSPALPAYIWLWPQINGAAAQLLQDVTYVYFIAGALFIGLRRWPPRQLGLNREGWWLSLGCGACLVTGRQLVIAAVQWPAAGHDTDPLLLAWNIVFYVAFVGLGEELLFRGLIYRSFETWRGVRWAIWGSTILFGLYHVPGQGLLAGLGTGIIGLVLALIRWRAGGIAGLIFVHGAIDLFALYTLPSLSIADFGQPLINSRLLLLTGYAFIVAVPLFLWKLYPRFALRRLQER